MKKITLVFTVMIYVLLLSSCSVEEVDTSKPKSIVMKTDFSETIKQGDSVSNEEDEIDPPKSGTPPIKI
ncbi:MULTISPECIES: hypothetical protein [Flavobacterium]|uniref:hypothetical protein n=1 Tax=Flavobacterium TaxID=237 RepID=UPI001FCC48B5|nr:MULTISPECIES: hypothetical protein [Flavobacterium]UOK43076.1 hypothetical protein LZF87_02895 [Flavobacterium enshiense]